MKKDLTKKFPIWISLNFGWSYVDGATWISTYIPKGTPAPAKPVNVDLTATFEELFG